MFYGVSLAGEARAFQRDKGQLIRAGYEGNWE